MPVVNIDMWPVDEKLKKNIIEKITKSFVELEIPAEAVTVIIRETPMENWGTGGEQHSVKFKDLKK
ncbi:4-oxalocrotonate tautomerase [Candidatus Pacearchaeota archaeon]|nr:4-oxalocrotonate tautomerase [Candidatus Pacearchaeota archaeon]